MKRTTSPDGSPRRKQTFGGATVDRFSPQPEPDGPATLNVVLTFEEALKLHLSISQLLGHLNGYDRATKEGRRTAVNLCIYTGMKRITVNEARLSDKSRKPRTQRKAADGQASE